MDKIILEIPELSQAEINFGSQKIYVDTCITLENRTILLENYISSIYNESNLINNYIEAEYGLMLGILDLCTNINISDDNVLFNINGFVASGIFKDIKDKITNYNDLRNDISRLIELSNSKKSIGYNFDIAVQTLISFINGLSSIDFSETGLRNIITNLSKDVTQFTETVGATPRITTGKIKSSKQSSKQTTTAG